MHSVPTPYRFPVIGRGVFGPCSCCPPDRMTDALVKILACPKLRVGPVIKAHLYHVYGHRLDGPICLHGEFTASKSCSNMLIEYSRASVLPPPPRVRTRSVLLPSHVMVILVPHWIIPSFLRPNKIGDNFH